MTASFEQTSVWRNLQDVDSDSSDIKAQKERLRSTFYKFRERSSQLVGHIASALPGLTIHDVTHLDALWETAELVIGSDYPLTPIEVFVLGGAILLHDSALCFEAYSGGRDSLRQTVEWKDSYVVEAERDPEANTPELQTRADFAALRVLHAKQAESLATRSWSDSNGESIYLIDDLEIRRRYGSLIGKIAASHHWSIDRVSDEFSNQINAPGYYPRDWRVDPIKIACILRCADAAHIDDRRAPDFLNALLRRQGLSAAHWKAQNRLNRIDVDLQDSSGSTLIITSSSDFESTDADAWWVAYDAVCLCETEIRASNALLLSRKLATAPAFKAQQISGAASPELMSDYIHTNGWEPRSAKLHVSNIEQLISRLGGKSLYGDGDHIFSVALRELLQNARDAVAARQAIDNTYTGRVVVTLRTIKDTEGQDDWFIDVEDDGVGMSDSVITGPLLDFGSSFWASNLVRDEFPGLRSSRFKSVGKFGVGFYSIFMVADAATVSSRKYDEGLPEIRTLQFPRGLTLRPILSRGRPSDFATSMSTKVTIKLNSKFSSLPDVEIRRNYVGSTHFTAPFHAFVTSLTAGCDVDVYCKVIDEEVVHAHRPLRTLHNDDLLRDWLCGLAYAKCPGNAEAMALVESNYKRLRFMCDEGDVVGLAALSIEINDRETFLSAQTVGGFITSNDSRGSTTYIGTMDFEPVSAKRDVRAKPKVSTSTLQKWADEQVDILRTMNLELLQWAAATYSLSELDIDPTGVFITVLRIDGSLNACGLKDIIALLRSKPLSLFKSSYMNHAETHHGEVGYLDHMMLYPIRNGAFLNIELKNMRPVSPNSFLGCLFRYADSIGIKLSIEERPNVAKTHFGTSMGVLVITAEP